MLFQSSPRVKEIRRLPVSSLIPTGGMPSSVCILHSFGRISGSLWWDIWFSFLSAYCLSLAHQYVPVCEYTSVVLFCCMIVALHFILKRKKMVKTLSAGYSPLDFILTHFKDFFKKLQSDLTQQKLINCPWSPLPVARSLALQEKPCHWLIICKRLSYRGQQLLCFSGQEADGCFSHKNLCVYDYCVKQVAR